MAGPSTTTSSMDSSHDFSVSRVNSNGNSGVVASVMWLTAAAGLCFPWLLEQPSSGKAGDTAKSVAWFVILALDLIVGTMSIFSLWFQKSTLSIMLLIWGACAILATFLLGSFAMLPAVATMCCCAPDLCIMGAADTSALDDHFCYVPRNLCMETRWTLWCYYGGILLAMISIVLLVNSVALHHKTLLWCERQRREAVKAARAAQRSRRRRQELWEEEVYGYAPNSAQTARGGTSPAGLIDENATTPKHRDGRSLTIAPAFQSPSPSPPRASAPPASAAAGGGASTPPIPLAPVASRDAGGEIQCCPSQTFAPSSRSVRGDDDSCFSIGTCTGPVSGRDGSFVEDGRRIKVWGAERPPSSEVVMSWVADEERITPKTALRFKTSALARAMHN